MQEPSRPYSSTPDSLNNDIALYFLYLLALLRYTLPVGTRIDAAATYRTAFPDQPTPRFPGAARHRHRQHATPRYRKRSRATSLFTQIAQRRTGEYKTAPAGAPNSPIPFGMTRYYRWLFSGDPLCCVCSLPSLAVSPIPFSGSLALLFEAYRT